MMKRIDLTVFVLCLLAASVTIRAAADTVIAPVHATAYLTAKGTPDRLARMTDLTFFDLEQPTEKEPAIFVDPGKQFQTLIG
ncbi:MAG TPA: hypothetical protein VL970_07720, partial [Candidatus Acidoferrales bacterium]|nr:hypothetical protein [Candidatus Acidoferrales bacterium]